MDIICTKCQDGIINIEDGKCENDKCDYQIEIIDWHLRFNHYVQQEKAILDFLQYVPYEGSQQSTYSPKLFDIIFNIGAGIEQTFRNIAKWPMFDDFPGIEGPRCERKNTSGGTIYPNIGEFIDMFNDQVQFHKHIIYLKYPEMELKPFNGVILEKNVKGKRWEDFNIYSEHKHQWIDMKKEFRIDRAIGLLGAYFLLICLNPREGNYEYLVSKGIIKTVPAFFYGYNIVDSEHYETNNIDLIGLRDYIFHGWRFTYSTQIIVSFETELFTYLFSYFHHSPKSRRRGNIPRKR